MTSSSSYLSVDPLEKQFGAHHVSRGPEYLGRVESARRLEFCFFKPTRFNSKPSLLIHHAGEKVCTGR